MLDARGLGPAGAAGLRSAPAARPWAATAWALPAHLGVLRTPRYGRRLQGLDASLQCGSAPPGPQGYPSCGRNPSAAPPPAQSPPRTATPRPPPGARTSGGKRGGGGAGRLPFTGGLRSVAEGHRDQNCAWVILVANGEVVREQGPPSEPPTPPSPDCRAPRPPVALMLGLLDTGPFLALCPDRPICPGLPGRCPDL